MKKEKPAPLLYSLAASSVSLPSSMQLQGILQNCSWKNKGESAVGRTEGGGEGMEGEGGKGKRMDLPLLHYLPPPNTHTHSIPPPSQMYGASLDIGTALLA